MSDAWVKENLKKYAAAMRAIKTLKAFTQEFFVEGGCIEGAHELGCPKCEGLEFIADLTELEAVIKGFRESDKDLAYLMAISIGPGGETYGY